MKFNHDIAFFFHLFAPINKPQFNLMKAYSNEYENDEIMVTYHPVICHNSEICAKGLSDVFRTSILPWIDLDGARTKEIISQIGKCPSGALKYCYKKKMAV